ncbi:O-antigen ligase family protein [Vibrio celticus]|uniref:O-antigen ligase family protein n=1 Tax=Vibrio celticus TaxID=446372 RepID=UPI0040690530
MKDPVVGSAEDNSTKQINKFVYSFIAIFICMSTLVMTGEGILKNIGYIFLLLTLLSISSFLMLFIMQGEVKYNKVSIFFLLYLCVCIFGLESAEGIKFVFVIIFYIVLYQCGLSLNDRLLTRYIYKAIIIYLCFIMVFLFYSPVVHRFSFIFNNPNSLALLLLCFSFFIFFVGRNRFFIFTSLGVILLLIFLSGSRAILGGYLAFIFLVSGSWVFKIFQPRILFVLTLFVLISLCLLYATSKGTEVGDVLNNLSRIYFEKNLYSGRQDIWNAMYKSLNILELIIGTGTGNQPNEITGMDLSAHNSFFQIIFQNGILGLLLITLIFYFSIPKTISSKEDIVKSSFLIAILIPASFEVFIFQNHTVISALFTLILFQKTKKDNLC